MPEGNPTEASVSNGTQNGSKFWTLRRVGQLLGRSWETIEKLHMPSVISDEPKEVTGEVDAAEGDPEPTAELVDGPNSSPVSLIAPHLAWRRQALLLQEGLHVAAVHIASLLGCEEGGWENFDFEALEEQVQFTLHGLLQGLEACNLRLERLYVDFDCLDDGAAEGLFGSEGMLKEELQEIQEVQGDCAALQKRCNGWLQCSDRATSHVMGLEALADFFEEAVPEMDRLVSCCGDFAARRRAAVARAKAAIETADAEERASAVGLLQEALSPSSRVDFPRITEICQRVADRPDEAEQSATMLWAALSSEGNSIEGHAEVPRRQLKALTIAHELLYDERVLLAFTEQDTRPLRGLESSRPGILGRAAEEAMRMLAAEVRRRVEEAREKRSTRRYATWSFTLRRGDGKSPCSSPTGPRGPRRPSQPRLRSSKSMPLEVQSSLLSGAKLEVFLRQLRRWGSWYRFDGEELQLLESLRENFRELLNALARLREELDCLDDGSSSMPLSAAVEEMASWLLLASQVQATASGWCQALASAEASREGIRPEAAVDSEKLADFVEEALTAESSLERQVQRFQQLRHQAVAKAKAVIEAGPLLDFEPEEELAEGMRLLDDAPLESLESQK